MSASQHYRGHLAKGRKALAAAIDRIWTLRCILRHPGAPWSARVVAGVSVMYLVSPIQLIPTFIPVIGQLDDLFVLYVGMKLVRKLTPKEIIDECEMPSNRPALLHRFRGERTEALEVASPATE